MANLPPFAVITFGATSAVIFAVRYLGLWQGARAAPATSPAGAQVAAVVVDPTALNTATRALESHTVAVLELNETSKENGRSMATMAIEMDRIREEMRIQREVSRRPYRGVNLTLLRASDFHPA